MGSTKSAFILGNFKIKAPYFHRGAASTRGDLLGAEWETVVETRG
jgi:hypothetical protein